MGVEGGGGSGIVVRLRVLFCDKCCAFLKQIMLRAPIWFYIVHSGGKLFVVILVCHFRMKCDLFI